jgi:hypothetical protein
MVEILLTVLACLLIGALSLAAVGVALLPVYLWVRYRDSVADLNDRLDQRYGTLPH